MKEISYYSLNKRFKRGMFFQNNGNRKKYIKINLNMNTTWMANKGPIYKKNDILH